MKLKVELKGGIHPQSFFVGAPPPFFPFFFILKRAVESQLVLVEKAAELSGQEHQLWSQTVWSPHLNLPEGMVRTFRIAAFLAVPQRQGLAALRIKEAGTCWRWHSAGAHDSGHASRSSTTVSTLLHGQ